MVWTPYEYQIIKHIHLWTEYNKVNMNFGGTQFEWVLKWGV